MKRPKTTKRAYKLTGRPRGTPKGQRLFPSMANAASVLGIAVETLKLAKRAGCAAFSARGSIDEANLLEWIKLNPEFSKEEASTKALIDVEILRRHRRNNDREDKKLIERKTVAAIATRIFGALMPQVEQKLLNEFPSAVAGLEPAQCRVFGARLFDAIQLAFASFVKEWE